MSAGGLPARRIRERGEHPRSILVYEWGCMRSEGGSSGNSRGMLIYYFLIIFTGCPLKPRGHDIRREGRRRHDGVEIVIPACFKRESMRNPNCILLHSPWMPAKYTPA
jgi:hypothetical protein